MECPFTEIITHLAISLVCAVAANLKAKNTKMPETERHYFNRLQTLCWILAWLHLLLSYLKFFGVMQ